jgi:hypothetical protein
MRCAHPLVGVIAASALLTACSSTHRATEKPPHLPKDRVIVLNRSIGPISLDERGTIVRRTLGPGKRLGRGEVSYFDGRLTISYWFHDQLTHWVSYIKTTWGGFHTRSGVRVGTSRRNLHLPRGSCFGRTCAIAESGADAPGTEFGIRAHKIAWIAIGHS